MPNSLLAMNQEQQNHYNQLIPAVDQAYNNVNALMIQSLEGYNQALLGVLENIRDTSALSLVWANNRMDVIRLDLEKSNVQFNAIDTIISKYKRFAGEARTRLQLAERNGQNPNINDENIVNSFQVFEDFYQRAFTISERIRGYAGLAETSLEEAIAINNVDDQGQAIGQINNIINRIHQPILNPLYTIRNIRSYQSPNGYHRNLIEVCKLFETFNKNIFNIKNQAILIRGHTNLPALGQILQAVEQEYHNIHLPI